MAGCLDIIKGNKVLEELFKGIELLDAKDQKAEIIKRANAHFADLYKELEFLKKKVNPKHKITKFVKKDSKGEINKIVEENKQKAEAKKISNETVKEPKTVGELIGITSALENLKGKALESAKKLVKKYTEVIKLDAGAVGAIAAHDVFDPRADTETIVLKKGELITSAFVKKYEKLAKAWEANKNNKKKSTDKPVQHEMIIEQVDVYKEGIGSSTKVTADDVIDFFNVTKETGATIEGAVDLAKDLKVDDILNVLDNWGESLTKSGKDTLGLNIPIVIAQGLVTSMKVAAKTAKTALDVISAGINYLKSTDWYKKLDSKDKKIAENNVMNIIKASTKKKVLREEVEAELDGYVYGGMTEEQALNQFDNSQKKMIAKDILQRRKPVDGKQALANAKKNYKTSMAKMVEKPAIAKRFKQWVREFARTTVDRQFLPKNLFKKNFGRVIRNYIITAKGATGYAKYLYDNARKEIYGLLRETDITNLNIIIFQKRLIAIDANRMDRGLAPVVHPHFENSQTSEAALAELKEELGDKKYNDLDRRADAYFKVFQEILSSYKDSGMINQETLDMFFNVNYNPRLYFKYIKEIDAEMSISEMGSPETASLSSGIIKEMEEGSNEDLIRDSEYLLARSLNIAARVNMANTLANRISIYLKDLQAKIKTIKEKPNKTAKDKRAIKNYEELITHIKENKIKGFTKKGNPKFMNKPKRGQVTFNYYKDGVKQQMIMSQTFKDQLTDSQNALIKNNVLRENIARYTWTGLLKAIATGINPAFFITNTPRDYAFVVTFSPEYSSFILKGMYQLGVDTIKGIKDILTDSSTFSKFVEHGGMMDFLHSQGRFKSTKGIKGILSRKGITGNRSKQLTNIAFNVFTVKKLQMLSEMGIRLGVFNRSINNQFKEYGVKNEEALRDKLKKDGLTEDEIGWKVKDIYINASAAARSTTDFSQGGTYTKDFDALVPYLNAGVQGTRAAVLALEEDPVGVSLRIIQSSALLATAGIGVSLLLFMGDDESLTDEVREMSPYERYKYARAGVSKYELINYQIFFTGKMQLNKAGEMEFEYYRVAKPHFLTPFTVHTENLITNQMYKNEGIEEVSRERMIEDIKFAIENNISPLEFGITGNLARNPLLKASLTYTVGYDFFRNKDLSYIKGDVLVPVEGHESKAIEQFYKDFGEKNFLSPARLKGAVEGVITSPSTSPYVSILYAIAENNATDSEFEFAEEFKKVLLQSFGNRFHKTTSDYNRQIDWDKVFLREITTLQIKGIKERALFKELGKGIADGTVSNEEVNVEFERMADEDVFEFKRLVNTFKEGILNPKANKTVIDLKFRKPYERALILARLFGDGLMEEKKELSKSNKKLRDELFSKKIMNPETIIKYLEIVERKGNKNALDRNPVRQIKSPNN